MCLKNLDLIKELCFEASENPELLNELNKRPPSLLNPKGGRLNKTHFHIVYLELETGTKIIYQNASDRPLKVPKIDFKSRLKNIADVNYDEVCFLITTYGDENIILPNNRTNNDGIPEKLVDIIKPTKGYLIYEEQGIELFRLLYNDDSQEAYDWINDVKKIKNDGWQSFLKMASHTSSLNELKNLFITPEYAPFFRPKPIYETYDVLRLISKDYQIVEEYPSYLHLRQDGFYFKGEQENLFIEDELLKTVLKKDVTGNFYLAFWLRNQVFEIDQEIELGLNLEYASLSNISGFTGWYVQPSEGQFMMDFTATIELPDKSDFYSISMKANFNFPLPEELKVNRMVYKLYQ